MAVIPGTPGNDVLNGTEEADQITGLEGDDVIFGGGGRDTIDGGAGNDFAQGDAENDSIVGGEGDDTLDGGDNNDTLDGGVGNDFLFGNFGNDSIVGGDGDDTIDGGAGDDTIDGGAGNNNTYGLQAKFGDGVYQYTIDDLGDEDASNDLIVAVRDLRTAEGNDGFDTLIDIQFIQFADYKIPALAAALDNDIPILTLGDDALNVGQLESTTITPATLSTTDTDNTAEQITYTVTDLPDLGNVVVNGTAIAVGGTFTQAQIDAGLVAFTNTSGDIGDADTFTFTVSDGLATLDKDPDLFDLTVTFEVVEAGNDDPVGNADSISANEDNPITVAAPGVLENDTDANGDPLTVSTVDGQAVDAEGISITFDSGGIATIDADGEVVFDPNDSATYNALGVGDTLDESFTYTVIDGRGGEGSATATITINGVNDAPIAEDDLGFTLNRVENGLTITVADLLSNDTDPDGDPLTITTDFTQGTRGIAELVDGDVIYTLNTDATVGLDTFFYQVSDGNGGTDTAAVVIDVQRAGAGAANDDSYTTGEDTPLTVDAPGVLENDEDPINLSITQVNGVDFTPGTTLTLSSRALLTLNADGSFTYNPEVANYEFEGLDDGETDVDSFTYTVDNGSETDTATVDITIDGSDDAEQVIRTSPKAPKIPIGGGDVDFDVIYDVNNVPDGQDPTSLRTLGLRLHYNSSLISIDDLAADLTNIFGEPSNFASQQDLADEDDFDADPTTDRFILASWVDLLGGEGELTLYNVNFTPTEAFTEDLSTEINFTAASTAAGFILDAPSITIEFNEDPDAVDDALTINADGTEPTGDTNLLANDTDPDNPDAEQTLSITQVNGTNAVFDQAITLDSGALLTVSEDGSYTYDPNGAFNDLARGETGTDSFTYTISDGLNGTDTATVNVTVEGVNNFTLDIDGNGTADALTDGILVLRHLFGFTGNSLTDGALAADATITDPATIAANLEANREALDIDDNGTTDALTDGILVLRDLFGFSGDALTAGALGEGAQRNTPEAVATYIDTLFPG